MEIIKSEHKETLRASPTTIIHEYHSKDGFISGGVAEINGRYPSQGFVINQKIKELVYILSGQGWIITPDGKKALSVGDVIFVDHGERFAWEGQMTMFMATTPSFDPSQHMEVD